MYLRLKSENQTIFVNNLELSDSMNKIKRMVADILTISIIDIELSGLDGELLGDESTISELELCNDGMIYFTKRNDGAGVDAKQD